MAPTPCETKAEIALEVCKKIQIKADINDAAKPIAPNAISEFSGNLPATKVSVKEIKGSTIPAKIAGIAKRLISLKDIFVLFK